MSRIYKLLDVEDGSVYNMTLPMILEEINRDRSEEWIKYDETDWREGLAEFTQFVVLGDEVVEEVTDNWIIVYAYGEWQVCDGSVGNRSVSYDFKTKEEAEQFLKELRS